MDLEFDGIILYTLHKYRYIKKKITVISLYINIMSWRFSYRRFVHANEMIAKRWLCDGADGRDGGRTEANIRQTVFNTSGETI